MGRDTLEVWGWENACSRYGHDFKPVYEDDILMGQIYYYDRCACGAKRNTGPGPLDLGTYK